MSYPINTFRFPIVFPTVTGGIQEGRKMKGGKNGIEEKE